LRGASCKLASLTSKRISANKLYVAEHYASLEFLTDLKHEITDSIRDLGRRIDHIVHSQSTEKR
jgi:hypothetical protein